MSFYRFLARITVFLRYSFSILLEKKIYLIVNSFANWLPAGGGLQNKRQALADGEDKYSRLPARQEKGHFQGWESPAVRPNLKNGRKSGGALTGLTCWTLEVILY